VLTDLAGDGNFKAIFAKLLKVKAITMPELTCKHSRDSSSNELVASPIKKRKGAMGSQAPRQRPYCNCCSSGQAQADCFQWQQARCLRSTGGAGGASGGGRQRGFKPKHGNKSNSK